MLKSKKLIYALIALLSTLVVALIAVVAVFAATQQQVTSNLSVTYKATNVSATVVGGYKIEGDSDFTSMGAPAEFLASTTQSTKNVNASGINLTDTKTFVVLRYAITNNSETAKIKVNLTPSLTTTNMGVTYAYSLAEVTDYSKIIGTNLTDAVLGTNQTGYVYVKVTIANLANNANFSGSLNFNLTYTEEAATETQGVKYTPKVGDKVTYGEYPQTYVGNTLNETLKNALTAGTLTTTGKTYTTDINNTATTCTEYSFEGNKYALVGNSNTYNSGTKFANGETITNGSKYFFKVEPIEFEVMAVNNAVATLKATKVLGSKRFNGSNNTWSGSELEAYLNSSFATQSGLSEIALSTTIKNNVTGNYTDGSGPDSTNKIWLASLDDLRTWYSDNSIAPNQTKAYLTLKPTDFAQATYTYTYSSNGNTYYFLRSAGGTSTNVCRVLTDGSVSNYLYNFTGYGFCPVLNIKI